MSRVVPPKLGEAYRDEEESREAETVEREKTEKLRVYETDHLCLGCSHEPVCSIASSIRSLNAEGDVVISVCGAFRKDGPTLEDLMKVTEGETDGE